MSDYAERIESIASKLRDLLEESEQLKQLVEQRMMLAEDTDASDDSELTGDTEVTEDTEDTEATEDTEGTEESDADYVEEQIPVPTELVTRKPWCWFCCRRY